jgi:hypothetical protein
MKIDDRYSIVIVVIDEGVNGCPRNVYNNFSEMKKENPHRGYRFGFCVIDNKTGFVPDVCNDWNDTPEEAMFDYYENCL